jgi:hypothetical protein
MRSTEEYVIKGDETRGEMKLRGNRRKEERGRKKEEEDEV